MTTFPLILFSFAFVHAKSLHIRPVAVDLGRAHGANFTATMLPPNSSKSNHVCGADAAGEAIKSFVLKYRVIVSMIWLTAFNFLWQKISPLVGRQEFAEMYECDTLVTLSLAATKVVSSPLLLAGYPLLLYYGRTGCNLFQAYLLVACAGPPLFELWEWVRFWPLKPAVLFHHVGSLLICLCVLELGILPIGGPGSMPIVLMNANWGLVWITDLFQIVFRYSRTARPIELFRYFHLAVCPLRLVNIGILSLVCVKLLVKGDVLAGGLFAVIAPSVGWQNIKTILWVWNFEPAAYFECHQGAWLRMRSCTTEVSAPVEEKLFEASSVVGAPAEEVLFQASSVVGTSTTATPTPWPSSEKGEAGRAA